MDSLSHIPGRKMANILYPKNPYIRPHCIYETKDGQKDG